MRNGRRVAQPTADDAEGAVGDDAGQAGGHDDLRLELGRAVQDLGGEQGAGQRGAEDGGDAGAHAGRQQDAPLGRRGSRSSVASNEPKPAPIWAIGPSRPPEPPVPMVRALATILMSGTRGADHALPAVVGGDGRVGAVPLRLG